MEDPLAEDLRRMEDGWALARGRVIIIMGPPCAGKGTQCKLLQGHSHIVHVSVGAIRRREIAEGTERGRQYEAEENGRGWLSNDTLIEMVEVPEERNTLCRVRTPPSAM